MSLKARRKIKQQQQDKQTNCKEDVSANLLEKKKETSCRNQLFTYFKHLQKPTTTTTTTATIIMKTIITIRETKTKTRTQVTKQTLMHWQHRESQQPPETCL